MGWSDDVLAYRLWAAMSRDGSVVLDTLDPDQRRVADEMLRRGLIWLHAGRMVQADGPIERWAGLA